MNGNGSFTSASQVRFQTWLGELIKRTFDCLMSLVGLILLSPFLALIVLAIQHNSPGPIFYFGPRLGQGGKIFKILKFRTMHEIPESYSGPKVTAHDDPRITRFGRWLRDTKLNELPQLWNVLVGDMSLVGPRPEDPEIAEIWPKEVRDEVLSVRPGITSPASVVYRNEEFLLSYANMFPTYFQELSPDKNRMDQLYVRNRSFWLDLDTLFWTFLLLLPKIGARTPPEEFLFVGPFTRLVRQHIRWFVIDLLVTFAAIGAAGVAWRVSGPLDVGWPKSIMVAVGFSFLFSLSGAVLGNNRISWSKAAFADGFDLLPAWLLATLIAYFANYVNRIFPAEMVLAASVFALSGYGIVRYRSRIVSAFMGRFMPVLSPGRTGRERVLIIGGGALAQHAVWLLSHPMNSMKYWVVGFVDNDLFKQGMRIYGVNVIGRIKDIPRLVKDYDVGVIILADHQDRGNGCSSMIDLCLKTKAKLLVLPDFLTVFSTFARATSDPRVPPNGGNGGSDMDCLQCMVKFIPKTAETVGRKDLR